MEVRSELVQWSQRLVVREMQVNECFLWLQLRVEVMDMDEEVEGEMLGEGKEEDEATMSTEVDEGSPVVLDSDLDDFGSPELGPTLERHGSMGGQINWVVQIEEEPLEEVEELVLNGVPPSYDDQVVHRLVPIEDSPPYKDSPRYSSVEL